jgi:AcrR family transcriptional regulator
MLQLRKEPQQDRARRRVQSVLDTADALLAAEGAEALTTTRVAHEMGVSVGSLYQWFPDREAIAEALALRHAEAFAAVLDDVEADVSAVVEAYAEAFRAAPAFRALLRTQRLRDVTRPALERIAIAFADRFQTTTEVAMVCVTTADALLRLAFRQDPEGDQDVLEQTKTMIGRYLARA